MPWPSRARNKLAHLEANLEATVITVYRGGRIVMGPMSFYDLMLMIKYGGGQCLISGESFPFTSDVRIEYNSEWRQDEGNKT